MNSLRAIHAVTVVAFLCISPAAAVGPLVQSGAVAVNEPGEWRSLRPGALIASADTGTGPSTYWSKLPEFVLSPALEFYFLTPDPVKKTAEEYGRLDFTASKDGTVWMLTTVRFTDSGNSSGDWIPEVSTEEQLKSKGWRVISRDIQTESGYSAAGENTAFVGWILFERTCKAGETFSIRTEKYQSPIIVRSLLPKMRAQKTALDRLALDGMADSGVYSIRSSIDLRTWRDELDVILSPDGFRTVGGSAFNENHKFFRLLRISR